MFKHFYRRNIQKLRLHIVNHNDKVAKILQYISSILSATTLLFICFYYGFYFTAQQKVLIHYLISFSLGFYVFKYLINLFYSIPRREYLRNSIFEAIILGILVVQFLLTHIFNIHFHIFNTEQFSSYYILFIQIYFFIVSGIDILKGTGFLSRISISPPIMLMYSFLILIVCGTCLLLMPRMTRDGISFIDALFTATSASSITGLVTVNTGATFTMRGQLVIMILIQMGGLSILSFASFFTVFLSGSKISLRNQQMIKELTNTDSITESKFLLKEIILASFLIELLGAIVLFFYWRAQGYFITDVHTAYQAIFHTVAAFNNSGFHLWSNSVAEKVLVNDMGSQLFIGILILAGGIGFFTLRDMFSIQNIKERRRKTWKKLHPSTRIILYASLIISVVGMLLFLFLEYHNSLTYTHGFGRKVAASLFQVVSTRSAGFNVVDLSHFALPTILMFVILMYIGASPGSTGGGIKVTTAYVIYKSVMATIRGKKKIEFGRRTIPFEIVDKSYSIVIMSLMVIILSLFILSMTEKELLFSDLLFETVSAFTTCGLSTGITDDLSWFGKLIIAIDMYIGRIGTLTIAFALSKRIKEAQHQYPNIYLMVG